MGEKGKKVRVFRIGDLEVMAEDAFGTLGEIAQLMGDGWRLPMPIEVHYLYGLHKMGIGGFLDDVYFVAGSDKRTYRFDGQRGHYSLTFDFGKGEFGSSRIDVPHHARFVREMRQRAKKGGKKRKGG